MKKNIKPSANQIEEALLKKALGYDFNEIVEEYVVDDDGECKLSKKKITKKYVSTDIPAAKVLLEHYSNGPNEYEKMSIDELKKEKLRLLELLEKEGGESGD